MKISLMIGITDAEYAEHLSRVLLDRYADVFDVHLCQTAEQLQHMAQRSYDVALLSPELLQEWVTSKAKVNICLCDVGEVHSLGPTIAKYQRISRIAGDILELYASVCENGAAFANRRGRLTVVWSPAGGCGKTTVALAFAARCASQGKETVYVDLENFSSVPAYFSTEGKSISVAFEKLDTNLELLLKSIRQRDRETGIQYFLPPDNYDDMDILTQGDLERLVAGCAAGVDEVILDISSSCDSKVKQLLQMADQILLVQGPGAACRCKIEQFRRQNNIYAAVESKTTHVYNRGTAPGAEETGRMLQLPAIQSVDAIAVYRSLAASPMEF